MTTATEAVAGLPDMKVSIRQVFGIDSDMEVPAYSDADEHVPDVDPDYRFDRPRPSPSSPASPAIAASSSPDIMGPASPRISSRSQPGSNWPCVRVNLDSHISRIDLIGKDAIVTRTDEQVTEFREGILPWATPAQHRDLLRRIRRRTAGRDVRDPARCWRRRASSRCSTRTGDPAASGIPAVRDRQYGRARRHHRALSRQQQINQARDGPLVHRDDAQIHCRMTRRSRSCLPRRGTIVPTRAATSSTRWSVLPISRATPS